MPDSYVPDEIRAFIIKHIDSVAQIEALLLIRSVSRVGWTVSEVAARLYIEEADAVEALDRLIAAGLLALVDDKYVFAPASPDMNALIAKLEVTYARHLIPVTNIIHAKPRRIRSFADAFRFRKGP